MVEKIFIKDEINSSLEMNSTAVEFLEEINKMEDNDILIDFSGVVFVSRSFAQSYFSTKKKLNKNITEINFSADVESLMNMIGSKFA